MQGIGGSGASRSPPAEGPPGGVQRRIPQLTDARLLLTASRQVPPREGEIHTCFLHLLHGSMYMASHIISTVLESAIVLGKGSDCIHKPNRTRRVRRQRRQAGLFTEK